MRRSMTAMLVSVLACALAWVVSAAPTAAFAEEATPSVVPTPSVEATLSLLAVGDLMVHDAQLKYAGSGGRYSFNESFGAVKSTISEADIAVGNLETTLAGRGFSGYPCFRSPRQYADALKNAGFDVLSTANNHSLDGGKGGVKYTVSYLDSIGVGHFGTNSPAPLVVERNGIKIAFLSYTYSTNGIRSPFRTAVNRMDLRQIRRDIAAVRPNVDTVVVFMHWGAEYSTSPERGTKSLGRGIIDAGADLVLGSHPHVVRPVEQYRGKYIVYSMGNFLSGQSKALTDLGIMARVLVTKKDGITNVSDMRVLPVFRDRSSGAGRRTYRTVVIDQMLARPDRLITSADRQKMAGYRTFCRRMFGNYYR
jgi:poly-gamma-glutamate capsule biosynthesis protein CapA/YwtB (metallophosphatase superfamily)